MIRILVPVDGSPSSHRAVQFVANLGKQLVPLEVWLLHVQTPPMPARAAQLAPGQAEDARGEGANEVLRSCQAMLSAAGIPSRIEMTTGYVPQAVARLASDMRCDGIVMGTRGMGSTDEVLGSIARQVINLADVPVVLIK